MFQALVLTPTRELANQVSKDFTLLSSLRVHVFYGGVAFGAQSKLSWTAPVLLIIPSMVMMKLLYLAIMVLPSVSQ